jgi:glycosyltransferase involved in cell wall biosynthesis
MKLLTLAMIVKDEAHTVERTLASVKPWIDRWVIMDTGSTDGTQEVIRRVMADLPGELFEGPFVDFATTRNVVMDRCGTETEFILWLDADEEVIGGAELCAFLEAERGREEVDRECYLLRLQIDLIYDSARVARSGKGWRFVGVVHEVLERDGRALPTVRVPEVRVIHGTSKERSARRWERDIGLLQRAFEQDPSDGRAAFYLANTYLWLDRYDEAEPWFRRRVAMGGWHEEVFESLLRIALMADRRKRPWPEVLTLYLDAYAASPHRAEPLYHIAFHYWIEKNYALGLLFARRAFEMPFPDKDILFVDEDVYRWKAADLVACTAYWVGEFALGERAARQAAAARPGDERLAGNVTFYLDKKRA